jgi:hypothetical protein
VFVADVSVSRTFFTFIFLSQLNEEENREDIATSPEGSTSGEGSSDSGGSSSSSSSDGGSDGEQVPEPEDDSPKVDVTN